MKVSNSEVISDKFNVDRICTGITSSSQKENSNTVKFLDVAAVNMKHHRSGPAQ
jgi:hypothetical protein